MKILLTGKNGQVGFELQRALAPLGEVVAVGQRECDLADAAAVRALVQQVRPNIIVNPAAYTAVDQAERERERAFAINAAAVQVLGEEAERLAAMVVHYSTDYVFDGTKAGAYVEDDPAHPQSVYGASKLAGEHALMQSCQRSLILRTSWVVGAHGGNFAKTMLRLAGEREALNVVADQCGAPTSAALLADITAHLLRQYGQGQPSASAFPFGCYHLTAAGATTWFDYACWVIEAARAAGKNIKVAADNIRPINTAQYPTPAKRPQNSRLSTERLQKTFSLRLPPWQEGVQHVLQQMWS